jgi:wyosine [tRNA(Phe)-imidazoG37] synthetase (radical SAM superfamily)
MIAFGPVPSRRFGKSIGINNIPPKICTYSCIYCQLGRTHTMKSTRSEFYNPETIFNDVKKKIQAAEREKEQIDYLTFVPDGEPTLDKNLGKELALLRTLPLTEKNIKIAVITNASLLWQNDVLNELSYVDCVSIKIDAVTKKIWQKINRPQKSLDLTRILEGITEFSHSFSGDFFTETMIIHDVNDQPSEFEKIADFIQNIRPKKSFLSIPTRPPAESWVQPASAYALTTAYHIFTAHSIPVEFLIDYEGNMFGYTGDLEENLLEITAVHPMRKDGVVELLQKANESWVVVEKLLKKKKLMEIEYNNKKYYMRVFPETKKSPKKEPPI